MLLDIFLISIVIVSAVYFSYRAYKQSVKFLGSYENDQTESMTKKDVIEILENELESRIKAALEAHKSKVSFKEPERYEQESNNNVFPIFKKVAR